IRIVTPCIPASSHALPFDRTYTALAGSSPTSTTAKPGRMPRSVSNAVSRAASSLIERAIATPSMSSAGKVHRACLADEHDLDLSGILKLGLDTACDLFAQCRHARIIDVIRRYYDANFAARLDCENFFDAAVARCNSLEAFKPLD